MAGQAFKWIESFFGNTDCVKRQKVLMAPSQAIVKGQALKLDTSGRVTAATSAAVVDFIAAEDATSTSTSNTYMKVISAGKGLDIWEAGLNLITGATDVLCTATGSTTTATFACTAGSSSDMIGGEILFVLTGDVRRITANTYGGGNCTVTFVTPLTYTPGVTTTIRVSAIGPGDKLTQLDQNTPSTLVGGAVIGDKTGGKVSCWELDIKKKVGRFTFNPS